MYIAVTEQGAYLKKEGERIVVEKAGERLRVIHLQDVAGIQLFGNIQLSTPLLQLCMQRGIAVHYLSKNGFFYGACIGQQAFNYEVKMAQLHAMQDAPFLLNMAKYTVMYKVKAQQLALQMRRHNVELVNIRRAHERLNRFVQQCDDVASIHELLGIEGASTRLYFRQFDVLLPDAMPFQRRSQRPAHNEMNTLLNYSYGVLKSEVIFQLQKSGLDVYLGYLHQQRHGRMSLVFDVMELFRPLIDQQIITAVRQRKLTPHHFEVCDGDIRLHDAGRKQLLALWYGWKDELQLAARIECVVKGLQASYVKKDVTHFHVNAQKALYYLL
ncbi:CRISPR-associated endonuclease Cas1 [Caryophanon latum]|uniref:CRISPR-associated endonuclease Cas1 n=1 Tax=Caryophanon latum TaxID=33977 RepID=A0A1C0YV19_9BACL|nr:CRISPR-associated endonuclease Cas1 [Caryophanon latum]OCS91030.1 CRISPR-associated endonuclease Cas1 [Caryophanon latum]